jgi:hypothetical protein
VKSPCSRVTFLQLAIAGGDCRMRKPVARQIDFEREIECAAVIALAVGVVEVGIPLPSGMMRIELLGASCQREATLEVTRID